MNMTMTELGNNPAAQKVTQRLVEREVIINVSTLVYELAQKAEHFPDYEEDLMDAFVSRPDHSERIEELQTDIDNAGKHIASLNLTDGQEFSLIRRIERLESVKDELEEEQDEGREVFEHWVVSESLASRLEDKGESIMRDFFGMTVWKRTTTGQGISIDGVIFDIAKDMEILPGQRYEWESAGTLQEIIKDTLQSEGIEADIQSGHVVVSPYELGDNRKAMSKNLNKLENRLDWLNFSWKGNLNNLIFVTHK